LRRNVLLGCEILLGRHVLDRSVLGRRLIGRLSESGWRQAKTKRKRCC